MSIAKYEAMDDNAFSTHLAEMDWVAKQLTAHGFPSESLADSNVTVIITDMPDGTVVAFGDANETWDGDVYASRKAYDEGETHESKSTTLSSDVDIHEEIVAAWLKTFA
jgi:hypothetical protein